MQRTDWAELFIEQFSALPLTAEFVLRSPKYMDRGITKEVCDLLLVLKGQGILVSMKCQNDPDSRSKERLVKWIAKAATEALEQAKGALRTIREKSFWCDHPRRGRIDFEQLQFR
jgi:hypothetical protein